MKRYSDATPAPNFSMVFQAPTQAGAPKNAATDRQADDSAPSVNLPDDEFGLTLPPPRPLPQERPRPQRLAPSRSAAPSPFSRPMDFSFGGGRPMQQRNQPTRYRGRGLAMGFAIPQAHSGGTDSGAHSGMMIRQLSGPALGEDWFSLLHEWWGRHGYYPREAAQAGEEGLVTIHLVVAPGGHVTRVELDGRSGSMMLDGAALSTFRDANLPPFPPGSDKGAATFQLTIQYEIIRE